MKRPPVEPTARAKTTDRAARWTPSQERAIAVRGKDVLVSAAAGSGRRRYWWSESCAAC